MRADPRPRIYHQTMNRLGDNPHLTVEDWRTVWLAWQGFQHTVHLVVARAETRAEAGSESLAALARLEGGDAKEG